MNAQNCPRCGRVFQKINSPLCPGCVKAEDEKFEEVRVFVKENPHCSPQEVSEACDISVKRVLMYVRDGRLEISQGISELLTCTKCGRPVKTGRMCEKCTRNAANAIASVVAAATPAPAQKARDANKDEKRMYTKK